VGDHVFLKVKANIISLRLGNFSKMAPHFCGPFEILEMIEHITYMISFTTYLCIHNVFHVSFLKKYTPNANSVIDWNVIQVDLEGMH